VTNPCKPKFLFEAKRMTWPNTRSKISSKMKVNELELNVKN
jgi:hypothetical protein